MADNASYPMIPHRPNFVDIRTSQVHEEKVTVRETDTLTSSWVQIYPAGATLENGVIVKVAQLGALTDFAAVSVTGLTADGGYQLDTGEEVFIPVRQLSNIWAKLGAETGAAFGATPKLTWKAS